MINVSEARRLIRENNVVSKMTEVDISEAFGHVLAEPVYAISDTPPFNQSAMDGYAFSFKDWDRKSNLNVKAVIQAGSFYKDFIRPMDAVRIFTGAALPEGTDTVVIQENVSRDNNTISINDSRLSDGSNVRLRGSQSLKGTMLLPGGKYLSPPAVAFLASEGISKVKVYSKPKISIIITGNELINPGTKLPDGKIYESNSIALTSALNQFNIYPFSVQFAGDIETEISNAINVQSANDIIILTGGISVGEFDFVSASLKKCGFNEIFHGVSQKPGKPFYFGKKKNTIVFALPGNPAAVLTCFYEYVVPAISNFTRINYLESLQLPLENNFTKKKGLTYFLKGKIKDGCVEILNKQESYLLDSFANADCLVEINSDKEFCLKEDIVDVLIIQNKINQ